MANIQMININQQLAELGIRNTPAKLNIRSPHMEMRIKTENAKMEIEHKTPSFRISRKKMESEIGSKTPIEFAKSNREQGRTGALRGAKVAVEDGNFLGEMRRKGDRVGQLARKKTMSAILKKQQVNIGLSPGSSAEVVWDEGSMSINWSRHSILIDWDGEFMPQLTVDPKYSVEIFLKTEPYFRVSVRDMIDPEMPGRVVDAAI